MSHDLKVIKVCVVITASAAVVTAVSVFAIAFMQADYYLCQFLSLFDCTVKREGGALTEPIVEFIDRAFQETNADLTLIIIGLLLAIFVILILAEKWDREDARKEIQNDPGQQ